MYGGQMGDVGNEMQEMKCFYRCKNRERIHSRLSGAAARTGDFKKQKDKKVLRKSCLEICKKRNKSKVIEDNGYLKEYHMDILQTDIGGQCK